MFDERTMASIARLLPFVLVMAFAALPARADDQVVPLGTAQRWQTEVTIVNPSAETTTATIERLTPSGSLGTRSVMLASGQEIEWSEPDGEASCALMISSDRTLRVKATRRSAESDAISSPPVVNVRSATSDGTIEHAGHRSDAAWSHDVLVVNPSLSGVFSTALQLRGQAVVTESALYFPARSARLLSIENIFDSPSRGSGASLRFSAQQPLLVFEHDMNARTGAQFFTPIAQATVPARRRAVRHPSAPLPQTVALTPSKDNTLYQTSTGSLSNGAGIHLFAGATNQLLLRRAVLAFDVASQIPPGSRVTRAELALTVTRTVSGPQTTELHRVTADWGEGTSNAGSSRDGDGASSSTGDATWIHRFFPDRRWSTAGGDFDAAADATASADSGTVTWSSSATLVARVQGWIDNPATNFGWIIVGNETNTATAKEFGSREIVPNLLRPSLTVEFTK